MNHHTEAISSRGLATALLTVLLATALPGIGAALPHVADVDESDEEEALYIGNINADNAADTVFGRITTGAQYRPTRIVWGTRRQPGLPADDIDRRTTRFIFPDWSDAGASISIGDMNADSLADMVLYLWGRDPQDDRATYATSVILFGAPGADTVSSIDLVPSSSSRAGALVAIPLASRGYLVNPAIRDHSGIASYVRLPIAIPSNEHPLPEIPGTLVGTAAVKLYPNPADGRVKIAATGLASGSCSISTLDLEGRVIRTISGEAGRDGRLTLMLDLESLPSGYYTVRIDDGRQIVKSLPLLVVH